MRLIDADRAIEIVHNRGIAHPNAYHLTNYTTLILREAPTVDAVEVVKCKDCLYFEKGKSYKPYCNHPAHGIPYPNDDDFCSYGERKDGDDE